jgi:tetratricopeptide (TPR) repeat protein
LLSPKETRVYLEAPVSELADQIALLSSDPTAEPVAAAVRALVRRDGALASGADAFAERARQLGLLGLIEASIGAQLEAAALYSEAGDAHRAAECYHQVLLIDPTEPYAVAGYGRFLAGAGRLDEVIEIYRRRLGVATDAGERGALYRYLSELGELVGDPAGAFQDAQAAVAVGPRDRPAIARLVQVGERSGRLNDVVTALSEFIQREGDPRTRAGLYVELAVLYAGPLSSLDHAITSCRSALAEDAEGAAVRAGIEELFIGLGRRDLLETLLGKESRRLGFARSTSASGSGREPSAPGPRSAAETERARGAPSRIGSRIDLGPPVDPLARRASAARSGSRATAEAPSPEPAAPGPPDARRRLAALAETASSRPADPALVEELLAVGAEGGVVAEAAETLERLAPSLEPGVRAFLQVRLLEVFQKLGRPEDAVRICAAILENDPEHAEARRLALITPSEPPTPAAAADTPQSTEEADREAALEDTAISSRRATEEGSPLPPVPPTLMRRATSGAGTYELIPRAVPLEGALHIPGEPAAPPRRSALRRWWRPAAIGAAAAAALGGLAAYLSR